MDALPESLPLCVLFWNTAANPSADLFLIQQCRCALLDAHPVGLIGIGICFSVQRPSAGTSKVIQRRKREKRSKTEQEKKHPTKLVKGSNLLPLKPPHDDNGLDVEGVQLA